MRLEHLLSGELSLVFDKKSKDSLLKTQDLDNLGLRSAINLIYSKLIEWKLQASSYKQQADE